MQLCVNINEIMHFTSYFTNVLQAEKYVDNSVTHCETCMKNRLTTKRKCIIHPTKKPCLQNHVRRRNFVDVFDSEAVLLLWII